MATPPEDNRLGRAYGGPEVTVFYDRGRCRHYAECVRGLPQVFDPTRRPWIRAELADPQAVAEVVRRFPTGALHYRLAADAPEEPARPTIITRDPAGPLLVRGDLVLDTPEGPLRETRAALCACGRTQNPPFCDGACGVNAGASGGTREQAETSSQEGRTRDGRRNIGAAHLGGRPGRGRMGAMAGPPWGRGPDHSAGTASTAAATA
jgi:uncharacterized Fe-S cluster protein YjdI/CDGSH-type Zn-finger protein